MQTKYMTGLRAPQMASGPVATLLSGSGVAVPGGVCVTAGLAAGGVAAGGGGR